MPTTTPLERNDLGAGPSTHHLSPMRQVVEPFADAWNDHDILAELADRLGTREAFTENRNEMAWVQSLYEFTRANAAKADIELPDFETFWQGEQLSIADQFRRDAQAHPLPTPSGKIELYSETIAGFGYEDCRGHPMWFDKQEWLGSPVARDYPLHLISNQPRTRLHSQYDHGITSRKAKIQDREAARMNPADAAARNIADGDVIRIFNARGACLAGILLTDKLRPGVIELGTGAWYDPEDPKQPNSLDVHGNPNVLTRDAGTSKLAQGPTAHSCLVQVERFDGPLPPIKVFNQPEKAENA